MESITESRKPFNGLRVIVLIPLPPAEMVRLAGERESENPFDPDAGDATVAEIPTEALTPPPDAITVSEYVPGAAVEDAVSVSVSEP